MKILSPRVHGYLDYAFAALLIAAPSVLGFHGTPAALCYILAVLRLGTSVMTSYPLGMVRLIPFSAHAVVDVGAAIGLVISPYFFRFADRAVPRSFFVLVGVVGAAFAALTDYSAEERWPLRHSRRSII